MKYATCTFWAQLEMVFRVGDLLNAIRHRSHYCGIFHYVAHHRDFGRIIIRDRNSPAGRLFLFLVVKSRWIFMGIYHRCTVLFIGPALSYQTNAGSGFFYVDPLCIFYGDRHVSYHLHPEHQTTWMGVGFNQRGPVTASWNHHRDAMALVEFIYHRTLYRDRSSIFGLVLSYDQPLHTEPPEKLTPLR